MFLRLKIQIKNKDVESSMLDLFFKYFFQFRNYFFDSFYFHIIYFFQQFERDVFRILSMHSRRYEIFILHNGLMLAKQQLQKN